MFVLLIANGSLRYKGGGSDQPANLRLTWKMVIKAVKGYERFRVRLGLVLGPRGQNPGGICSNFLKTDSMHGLQYLPMRVNDTCRL